MDKKKELPVSQQAKESHAGREGRETGSSVFLPVSGVLHAASLASENPPNRAEMVLWPGSQGFGGGGNPWVWHLQMMKYVDAKPMDKAELPVYTLYANLIECLLDIYCLWATMMLCQTCFALISKMLLYMTAQNPEEPSSSFYV